MEGAIRDEATRRIAAGRCVEGKDEDAKRYRDASKDRCRTTDISDVNGGRKQHHGECGQGRHALQAVTQHDEAADMQNVADQNKARADEHD